MPKVTSDSLSPASESAAARAACSPMTPLTPEPEEAETAFVFFESTAPVKASMSYSQRAEPSVNSIS